MYTRTISSPAHVASFASAISAALAALALVGCSSVKLDSDVPVESRNTATGTRPGGATGAGTGATGQSNVATIDLSKNSDDAANGAQRVIYFDFDSYVVKDEYRPIVDRYAKSLVAERKKHLQVEGHTDERGGREYNLALGQKRAESVAKSLALLGAADTQIEAVSFGKERPAAQGSDEAAWAKNRRAELNYR
jgi:peptidoglycan-associated lipoprotein